MNASFRPKRYANLRSTGVDDGRLLAVLHLTRAGSRSLESLDDVEGFLVSDFAEDDVLAIEPISDDGGDEELRAVAIDMRSQGWGSKQEGVGSCLRVGSSVGHGEKSRLGVLAGEVLVGELLTVDGLATGALYNCQIRS